MKRTFLLTIFFSFFFLIANWGFSQTSISGVINSYAAVDSIYPTKDTIEVSNPASFHDNDTVMIYQVKGAEPETSIASNPYNFGGVRNFTELKEAGKYEILLVKKVDVNKIIFKAILSNTYDTDDLVQLIRVPSFKNVSVDSELTCDNWNGTTGGVLALMVSDTLFLNDNINVTGKGFRGWIPFQSNGECSSVDSALYGSQYFHENATTVSAGFKGEGVAKFDPVYRKGLGRWANAGGGGNARFAGGGGGGNSGNGGYGGEEDTTTCITPAYETNLDYDGYWNALGGSEGFGLGKQSLINDSTIFLGGSGGSGTYTSGLIASSGGNGGGIVIIIAKVIKSSGDYEIIADGESVIDIADASGGGGGAGGTVAFDVDSVIGDLHISFKGGDGGWVKTYGASGPGGGGGGGAILYNRAKLNDDFSGNGEGGKAGSSEDLGNNYSHKAFGGGGSVSLINNVKMPLTGFLFNSITSNQEVCMGSAPEILSGSEPRGGNNVFTIQWEDSPDGSSWLPIGGATSRDYQPPVLTDTTYYRRLVTSGGITDFGNDIQIIVHDLINKNNIWSFDVVKCIGNEADSIIGDTASFGGDKISYEYIWEYSFDENNWITETSTEDTIYKHGIITDTTFVRRIVVSGACYDTVAVPIEITGLPQITNNLLSPDQEICEGQIPVEIIGGIPQDGDGVYTIFWEESADAVNWSIVADSARENLAPGNLIETTYYKRTVQSDDCEDISENHKVNVLIPISNDFIDTSLLIFTCYNTTPNRINGSTPLNGDGTYRYQWQESSDANFWSDISSNANNKDYQPVTLIAKTYYRRLVSSGVDDCCTSITDTIQVDIYSLPIASIANELDTICSGEDITLNFSLSSGQQPFVVTYNDGYNDITSLPINTYNPIVNPESIDESKEYNFTLVSVVDDNACEATDMTGLTHVTVYGIPTSNAGINDEICLLTYQLNASPSLFGTGIWSQVSGEGITTFNNETSDTSTISVDLAGVYTYKWKETNWECKDSANVEITLYERPFNIRVNPSDTTLFFIDELELKGTYQNPDSFEVTTTWEFAKGSGIIEPSVNDSVVNLTSLNDLGEERIIINWIVEKGNETCLDSVVNIPVKMKELYTPTGFTPNGDGVNDYLKFNGIENSDENELIIYNRWGTEIYRVKNYSNDFGWDGKNKDGNDLPEDTYYYILNVTDDGVSQTHKGFIVIKRY